MNKIKSVKINEVVVYGFKGYEEQHIFSFEELKNIIIGDNGKGKSSIGEAIVWCFTGRNIEGNQKDLNVINNKSKTAYVSVTFDDENGQTHVLERKANSVITIKFDSIQTSQEKLKEIIDTDLFLLIFNPLYFQSLDANNARKTIFTTMPQISKSDIFATMDKVDSEILENETFNETDTNEYLKSQRKRLKEIEDNKKHINGYMEKLQQTFDIPEEVKFDNSKITDIENELEVLNTKKPQLINIDDLLIKKAGIEKQILEIKSKKFESEIAVIELRNQKNLLEQKLRSVIAKEYTGTDVSEYEKKAEILRVEYSAVTSASKGLEVEKKKLEDKKVDFKEGDICPLCKQLISAHSVNTLNTELRKEVTKSKNEITEKQLEKRKTLAQLAKEGQEFVELISKAKKADDEAKKKFEESKESKINSIKAEIAVIDKKLGNLNKLGEDFNNKKQEEINPLLLAIKNLTLDEIETKNNELQKIFDAEILKKKTLLQDGLIVLRKEKEAVISNEAKRLSLIKSLEENNKEIESKNKELAQLVEEENNTNNLISAMKSFNAQKTALLNKTISKYLTNVSLKLEKLVESTGEVKDVFDILYNEKDLKVCSKSECIKAGLELSKMISELSGCNFPVFVDNGESITSYDDMSLQIIETRVVEGSKLVAIKKDGTRLEVEVTPIPTQRRTKEVA
ncbi:MAG: hypothetical protein K0R54_237 [Clostridiaceae bacterium]|jgi:DNA repair exonuclease SbcCD ATPase subunit|nr:hypothetical protein [Clostridiaceae bacterium]